MATPCHGGGFLSRCCFLIGCGADEEGHVTNERKGDGRADRPPDHNIPFCSLLNSLKQNLLLQFPDQQNSD